MARLHASRWRRSHAGRSALALVAVGAGLVVSACGTNGEATKPPRQILGASASALAAVKSYEVQGKVPTGSGLGTFDFQVAGGNSGQGTFSMGSLTFQLEELKGTDYIKSPTLWQGVDGGVLQQLLSNRWVSVPADNPLVQQLTSGLSALTSAKLTAQSLTKNDAQAKRGRTTTWDGQGVVEVQTAATAVYVATSGQPYPLRVVGSGGSYLNLSHFNSQFSLTAPKGAVSLLDVIAGLGAGLAGSGGRN